MGLGMPGMDVEADSDEGPRGSTWTRRQNLAEEVQPEWEVESGQELA